MNFRSVPFEFRKFRNMCILLIPQVRVQRWAVGTCSREREIARAGRTGRIRGVTEIGDFG